MLELTHYEVEIDGDVLIVVARTSVVDATPTDLLEDRAILYQHMTDQKITRLVMDFRRVSYFSSSVINTLTFLRNATLENDGRMAVCSLSALAREVLAIAGVDAILDLYPSQCEALAHVQS